MSDKPMHYDADEVVRSERGMGAFFGQVITGRLSRRNLMKHGLVATMAASVAGKAAAKVDMGPALGFEPIAGTLKDAIVVPNGYKSVPLVKWGDALTEDISDIDLMNQTGEAQAKQFGYNNDFVGYLPLPVGSDNSEHGLLAVNHEYVNPELMFENGDEPETFTERQVQAMKAAMGMSVVEVKKKGGEWKVVKGGDYSRRFTADSPFEITGPARGHDLMKTSEDPSGLVVNGTMANCSAGNTPWGTVLSGEENFQSYFGNGKVVIGSDLEESFERYGIPEEGSRYGFERHDPRFDVAQDVNECHRFGWVVEIDPYDPTWVPKKRTALGRYRHEAATTHVSKGDRVVMYSGCDGRFEYIFKFVCADKYNRFDRNANRDLMDSGILYVAKFNEDGSGEWIALEHGRNGLTEENGFKDQGDVVINARLAGDLVGATKMDRPEDIEVNPVNEKVYIVCTNNTDRGEEGKPGTDAMNPRDDNKNGHIIELIETDNDHAGDTFSWEILLLCGDPKDEDTYYAGFDKNQVSPISCPDNIAFDEAGTLWIATDGAPKNLPQNDGFFACPVEGPERGKLQQFMSTVKGSEVCGPAFTPDGATLFLAIQHPGEGSKFGDASTSWPDGGKAPKPSIVVITADHGGRIGSGVGGDGIGRRDLLGSLFGK